MLDVTDGQEFEAGNVEVSPPGVLALLRDAHRAASRVLSHRIAPYGVTIGQWHFLRALWEQDGLTQRELSHKVGMMEPTTVTALGGMERGGLVHRVRNPKDRRKLNVFLTERGRSLERQLRPIEDAINEDIHKLLNDAESIDGGLQSVIRNLAGSSGRT